ncbi:MAG TPA: tetratricopeptide repeat protein [Fimbriiglobus sp.]|nr:tetratricopeptide repeat protein [Fimbriiglobus sp.]
MRRLGILVGGWAAAAVGCFAPLPDLDRPLAPAEDALTRAADCLDRGDEAGALPHLQAHLAAHPDALMIRAHLAELLLKRGDVTAARGLFERFVADAQLTTGPANAHLAHCHARLMAIAEETGDAYREGLHRGVGLLLLVQTWDADPDRRDESAAERTLAKAAAALRAAAAERPGDARANLYLSEVYARLGQPSASRATRRTARAGLPDPTVTPAERERLAAEALAAVR